MYNTKKKVLYVYTSGREIRNSKEKPKEFFYGYFNLKKENLDVAFIEIDKLFSKILYFSITYWILKIKDTYILKKFGIGLRGHMMFQHKKYFEKFDYIIGTNDSISLGLSDIKKKYNLNYKIIYLNMGLTSKLQDLKNNNFKYYKKARNIIETKLIKIEKVISVGEGEYLFFKKHFNKLKNKFKFTPFGIDHKFWSNYKGNNKKKFVLFVGSDSNRDFKMMIKISKNLPHTKFVFVTSRIKLDECNSNVTLYSGSFKKPNISDSQLRKLYNQAYLTVIPVKKNTLMTSGQSVCMQAMSANCLVLTSKFPGLWDLKNLINKKNILITEHNTESFCKIIIDVIKKDKPQIRKNAEKFIINKCSLKVFSNSLSKEII